MRSRTLDGLTSIGKRTHGKEPRAPRYGTIFSTNLRRFTIHIGRNGSLYRQLSYIILLTRIRGTCTLQKNARLTCRLPEGERWIRHRGNYISVAPFLKSWEKIAEWTRSRLVDTTSDSRTRTNEPIDAILHPRSDAVLCSVLPKV